MSRNQLRITSTPAMETREGRFANPRWMALLETIGTSHSISAAARAVGLSYKAAWDAVEAMNNLSEKPLVQRTKGGKGGGGTKLTARGIQLVTTFRAVEAENTRFLKTLNSRIKGVDRDLRIIGRLAMLTSARNHFSGKVLRITRGAVNDQVELALPGAERVVAIVTHESCENLGLKTGSQAIALVKASSVLIATESASKLKLSARNQLRGKIKRITPGAVNTDVVIELKGGTSVAAVITNTSAKDLKLAAGKTATAIFKASSVILGVSS